ncbi:MAG: hypothetical protein MRK02_04195 [Candidatus Scalindua sp.]|nr:hypothetical protein [Candidatus Scalindua sp.]
MKYKDIVNKLNHIQDDGYFNNHHSRQTHGTGPFNQFPFYTIDSCECASCIAHALAFGMRGHYEEEKITEEIIEELKGVYGIEYVIDAVKEEEKSNLNQIFLNDR